MGAIQDKSISLKTPEPLHIWGRLSKVNVPLYLLCLLHIPHLSSLMIAKQGNPRPSLGSARLLSLYCYSVVSDIPGGRNHRAPEYEQTIFGINSFKVE